MAQLDFVALATAFMPAWAQSVEYVMNTVDGRTGTTSSQGEEDGKKLLGYYLI
jgi:hypothetical protein